MNNNLVKGDFLNAKFNELNNSFLQHKQNANYMSVFIEDINSINELKEKDRYPMVSYLNSNVMYSGAFVIITNVFRYYNYDHAYNDECIKYVREILWELLEKYYKDVELDTEMGLVLINYKNGILNEEEAFKKYDNLQKLKLKRQIEFSNKYKKEDMLLKLFEDKEKIYKLGDEFLSALKIRPLAFFSQIEILKNFPSINFGIEVDKNKGSIEGLIYRYGELALAISQVQNNMKKDRIGIKNK